MKVAERFLIQWFTIVYKTGAVSIPSTIAEILIGCDQSGYDLYNVTKHLYVSPLWDSDWLRRLRKRWRRDRPKTSLLAIHIRLMSVKPFYVYGGLLTLTPKGGQKDQAVGFLRGDKSPPEVSDCLLPSLHYDDMQAWPWIESYPLSNVYGQIKNPLQSKVAL